jgi:hypothetical protein
LNCSVLGLFVEVNFQNVLQIWIEKKNWFNLFASWWHAFKFYLRFPFFFLFRLINVDNKPSSSASSMSNRHNYNLSAISSFSSFEKKIRVWDFEYNVVSSICYPISVGILVVVVFWRIFWRWNSFLLKIGKKKFKFHNQW